MSQNEMVEEIKLRQMIAEVRELGTTRELQLKLCDAIETLLAERRVSPKGQP